MNSLAQILPMLLVMLVVMFTSGLVQQLVLNMFGVQNIANPGTQKFVRAVLKGFVFTAMFAIGFALIGNPYTLLNFIVLWGFVGALEYILPARPTR
jgi:hypothetical protein